MTMTGTVEVRLRELNLELPDASAPIANYVPHLITGTQLYISGQVPLGPDGLAFQGKVGVEFDVDQGQQAARLCALNILAQARDALGDLDRIERCLRLGGFVNAAPDFTDHPMVVNGASDLMVDVLGDRGRHTRFAVGVSCLPLGAAVEVDAQFAIV
jgi:enamine deaminase RidA (YjgF/YER057c/UK114 family)